MARPIRWIDPPLVVGPLPVSSGAPIVDALLAARGVTTASAIHDWLDPSPRPAPDPGLLPRMDRAVARTLEALGQRQRIGIFGDYDADGVTATAILARALAAACGSTERLVVRLPERAEGYGLTPSAVDAFAEAGVALVIAVDCGSNDTPALDRAQERGLDVIVLDHHRLTRAVGDDEIIVNPQMRPDGVGAELTGAGLAYCFVAALAEVSFVAEGDPEDYLDLAAVGTIVDVGSLTGLNRNIVRDGVARLRRTRWPGLRALIDSASVTQTSIDTEDVAFKLGPRLNAAGRVDSPRSALDLLRTDDPQEARRLATVVEASNGRRKTIAEEVLVAALAQVEASPGAGLPIAVAHGSGWAVGVVGAVAGKLADRLGVPVLVLTDGDGGLSTGSARSVGGFDLFGSLSSHADLVVRFGGHQRAAGLTIATEGIPRLIAALHDDIIRSGLESPAPIEHRIDADLRASDLTLETVRAIARLAPFGTGNPRPLLRVRGARVLQFSRMGAGQSHLRVVVAGPGGEGVKAVMFGAGDRGVELAGCPFVDVLATLELDTWGGTERLGLKLVDFRAASAQGT